ncbi:MAG: transposase, partial [Candidatus Kaelpia imicola]|nr:transposase [Candidatus Kaelpia imicola]
VSHGTASRLMKILDNSLTEFRTKKINDEYKYLMVDAIWVHVKESNGVKNRPIIVVLGIGLDNTKEILAFKLTTGESEAAVTPILNDLYRRGLEGRNLKAAASDGAKGIRAAIDMVYPYAKWQLCSTHKIRNLCSNIEQKKKHRKEISGDAGKIYEAERRKEAVIRFGKFCDKWEPIEEKSS